MTRGLVVLMFAVLVGLVGCVGPGDEAIPEERWITALPPGMTATMGGDTAESSHSVLVSEGLDSATTREFTWSGALLLVDLTPRAATSVAVSSTGSRPLAAETVSVLQIDGGFALPVVDRSGQTLGMVSAGPGRYGSVLDVDADGDADIVETITTGDVVRVVITTDDGREFLDRRAEGECSAAGANGWSDDLAIVVDCGDGPGATGAPTVYQATMFATVEAGLVTTPALPLRDPLAEPTISDGDQLIADLERYGAGVVVGAVLNDLVGDVLPDTATETLGALGDIVADDEGDSADIARILSRSTDDLRDAVAEILAGLGGAGDESDESDSGGSAEGCELTNDDGSCVDGDDAGSRGDPHHTTHDGLTYDFQAVGEYLLTRTATEQVHVRYEPYFDSRTVSVLTALAVQTPVGVVQARLGDRPFTLEATWNGDLLTTPSTVEEGGTRVVLDDATLTLVTESGFRLVVRAAAPLLNSYLAVEGPTSGMLGDNDGDGSNDLRIGDRLIDPDSVEITTLFADAWRLADSESLLPYRAGESTATFSDPSFPDQSVSLSDLGDRETALALVICREQGVLLPGELASCVYDVVVTGDSALADGYVLAAPPADEISDERVFRVSRSGREWAYPVVGWATNVLAASDAAEGDPTEVLGPQNTRNASIGEGNSSCEHPLDLLFDATIIDGPGPDLGVAHIGIGSLEYDVWIADGDAPWVFVATASGRSVIDLESVLGDGETADRVRLCDAAVDIDGDRQPAPGPAFDAVAILGIRG